MPADLINLINRTLSENSFWVWVVLIASVYALPKLFAQKPATKVRRDNVDGVELLVCPHCFGVIAIHYDDILTADPHDEKHCPFCRRPVER